MKIAGDNKDRVMLVDDEPNALVVYGDLLRDWGLEVLRAAGTMEAMEILRADRMINLAVIDLKMPEPDGMTLFRWMRRNRPKIPVVILTAYGSIDSAVEAISEGAFHYLAKPPEVEQFRSIVDKALSQVRMAGEIERLKERLKETLNVRQGLVGQSAVFAEAVELAGVVAGSEAPVLIFGETGTGKEVVARHIHRHSRRSKGPFVSINCGALPPNLLESELFGHEKGAFTGAVYARKGRFEEADGGTIFLDEIGDCSADLQVKLLRILEEKKFSRLGSGRLLQSDFRLVAATNRDLTSMVKEGFFREDLYFRMNVFEISLPPLRERMEDLPSLAWHFLRRSANREGRAVEGIEPGALETMMGYHWPGNIRELENVIHRGVVMADGAALRETHLPRHIREMKGGELPGQGAPWPVIGNQTLAEWERMIIRVTLARSGGNKSRAARVLGISRKVLYSKIRQHRIGPV